MLRPWADGAQPAELLVALRLPPPPPRAGALYIKHSPRSTMDIATVGVASVVALGEQPGVCQEVKIALGAVAPTVVRATAAEALLRGQSVDAERLQQVAHAAAQAANPIDDIRGTAAHRRGRCPTRTADITLRGADGPGEPFAIPDAAWSRGRGRFLSRSTP